MQLQQRAALIGEHRFLGVPVKDFASGGRRSARLSDRGAHEIAQPACGLAHTAAIFIHRAVAFPVPSIIYTPMRAGVDVAKT